MPYRSSILSNPRWEAFAQAVARGVRPLDACAEAGFAPWARTARRLAACEAITQRVKAITEHLDWGGSRELGPVIDELASLARAARDLNTGAALAAARGLLAEAARLKLLLPRPRTGYEIDEDLTHDEWRRKYGAKS